MVSCVRHVALSCALPLLSAVAVAASNDRDLVEAVRERDSALVQNLLRKGVDPNTRHPDGATALHWAAQWDDLATVDLLIRAGASVNVTNDYGVTPIAVACQNGSAASARVVQRLLREGADPNAALPSGQTVLMTASLSGNRDAVGALLAAGARVNSTETVKGQTALMWAASEGHRDVVEMLIARGADVNARSMSQFTALLFASRGGDTRLAQTLLAAGADINAKAADGNTPLLVATFRGHVDLARALLEAGADPDASLTDSGYTALHWASGKAESHETVPYARSDGEWAAQVGIPTEKGQLTLIDALLARGADRNARARRSTQGPRGSARIEPFSDSGATPFWLAARAADVGAMRLLVAHGADPLLPSDDGTTPLMAAAGGATLFSKLPGSNTLVLEVRRVEASRLALELGANVNQANAQGNTALHAAAFSNLPGVAAFLIVQGAKLNLRNEIGDTPLKVAEGYQAAMTVATSPEVADIVRKGGGVARPGPPGLYDPTSAGSNLSLRTLLEERAVLMNQIEALESQRPPLAATAYEGELAKLQTALAAKDEAIKSVTDASFYFYDEKRTGR
jgi:ankyrin repeat protein